MELKVDREEILGEGINKCDYIYTHTNHNIRITWLAIQLTLLHYLLINRTRIRFKQLTESFTYNFCDFATLPEGLHSKGVDGPLHGDGIHLHHSVILTKHKHTLI